MSNAYFSVYDFTVKSFRVTLDNVRLLILSMLTFAGGIFAASLGALLIVSPTILKFWNVMLSFKQSIMSVTAQGGMAMMDKATQTKMMLDMWQEIRPMLTTFDFVLVAASSLFFAVAVIGLIVGFFRMTLDVVDHGTSSPVRVLSGFSCALRFLIASIVSMIVIIFGFILFIVPGIILVLRLRFFPYYIIDRNMGALESLKASYRATKGLEWEVLGLNIIAAALVVLAPVIGLPVTFFLLAFAYRALPR